MSNNNTETQDNKENNSNSNSNNGLQLVSGSVEEVAKQNDNKTLSSIKNKIYKKINEIQNGEALENSRLQATLNTLATDMSKYANSKQEYDTIAPELEKRKKATAEKLHVLNQQMDLCNQAINLRLRAGEAQIQENIQKMANSAAKEGFKEFPKGQKTPDQHTEEEGKKAFQSQTGKEVEDPQLNKKTEQQQQNKK